MTGGVNFTQNLHIDFFSDYYDQGFLQIQHALHRSVINYLKPSAKISQIDTAMERFPYPPYTLDPFIGAIETSLPLFIMLCFIFFSLNIPKEVTFEKEQKLKVRGLHRSICSRL